MSVRNLLAGLFLLVAAPSPAQELTSSLTLDKAEARLSESVRVKLEVEGPAPLRVTVPDKLLTPESDAVWKVRAVDSAVVTDIGPNRQQWSITVRLDPYIRGDAVKLAFAPFDVVAGTDPTPRPISWLAKSVRVWTVASLADDVRVTGIEALPHPAPAGVNWTGPILALSAVVVAAGAIGFARYRRHRRPVLSADERIELKLGQAGDGVAGAAAVAEAVRGYVEAVYAIPATRLTTTELQTQLNGMPAEAGQVLVTLLAQCDSAKFAGEPVDRTGLIEQAREFVAKTRPVSPG